MHYCEGQSPEPRECCYSIPHTSSLGTQLQLEEENMKWNCYHFVPLFQGKRMVSEAVEWLQSYNRAGMSLFFSSCAWRGSVGADICPPLFLFFHNTSTCHLLLCLRCLTQAVLQSPCIRLSEHFCL